MLNRLLSAKSFSQITYQETSRESTPETGWSPTISTMAHDGKSAS